MPAPDQTITAAEGFAELGLHLDAWEALESLPPSWRTLPQVLVVRLMICTGLGKWELGSEIAKLASPESLPSMREAGRFYLGHAVALWGAGDAPAARGAVARLVAVWPEGRALVVSLDALEAVWCRIQNKCSIPLKMTPGAGSRRHGPALRILHHHQEGDPTVL